MRDTVKIALKIQLDCESPSTLYGIFDFQYRVEDISIGSVGERVARLIF